MSWVIICRDDGFPVFETWNPKLVRWLRTDRYRAVPIGEYLVNANRQIRQGIGYWPRSTRRA